MLKKFFYSIIFVYLISISYISSAMTSYIGYDNCIRNMNWSRNFGGNLFIKQYPEMDFYFGLKPSEYFSFQFGYRVGVHSFDRVSVGNTVIFGNTINASEKHMTEAQFRAWHAELVGYIPINCPYYVYIFGSVGLTRFELFQSDRVYKSGNTAILPPALSATFCSQRIIPSLGLGLEIKLDDRSSIRIKFGWDNTENFYNIKSVQPWDTSSVLKLKNSYSYGIGVIIRTF